MKYNHVFENSLKKLSSLQRVRIKTDPKFFAQEGLPEDCPSYEGYILEEDLDTVKVVLLAPKMPIKRISLNDIETVEDNDTLTDLKLFIANKLNLTCDSPVYGQIHSATTIYELEVFLKQFGLDAESICDLYGEYITN